MKVYGDIVILTKKEVKDLIDKECHSRLGITRLEFIRHHKQGTLPSGSSAVCDIKMLLKLI